MFRPPRCPNPACRMHTAPRGGFYHRCGTFAPQCRATVFQRFRCRACRRTFSLRTFKSDYRDRKPHLNQAVFSRLCSGTGYRQTARELGLSLTGLYQKARKISRHLAWLHDNLMGDFRADATFSFDELETFEGCRSTCPLTVPVLIERGSMLIVAARSGKIRPSGRMTAARRKQIAAWEARHGRRPNESSLRVREVLSVLERRTRKLPRVVFVTDEKKTYPKLLREVFGAKRLEHEQVSSKRPRDCRNPLFRINLTHALARDRMARLHRRSWCVTKEGLYLDGQYAMWAAYRNYHRNRFNHDRDLTPAMLCGFVPRPLTKGELLSWRQDWGRERSTHPLAVWGESVAEYCFEAAS